MIRPGLCVALLLLPACRCGEPAPSRSGKNPPVVVVDPDEVNRPKPLEEKEPNDRRREAQDLPSDRQVEGQLEKRESRRGDVDWYRFRCDVAGQVATVELTGIPDGDLVLEAFDERGKRLVQVNNTRDGGGETLVNLAAEAGSTFLVRVRARKGKVGNGRYRISYSLRPRDEGEEIEPNWKAPLASTLAVDAEATGYLGWHTDTDWFRLELGEVPQGARLRVEFDGVDNVRAGLSLRGKNGEVLQERWGSRGEPVVLHNLRIPGPEVFVVVRCRYEFNVESRYTLRALPVVPSGPTEVEPNDTPKTATSLSPDPRVAMAGLMADTSDRDLFHVAVVRPRLLRVEVVPPHGVDLALALLDPDGNKRREVDVGQAREREILPAVWVRPPGALFQVRAARAGQVSATAPYHVKASFVTGEGVWEREPNDSPGEATAWGGAQPEMKGFLHPPEDVDFYRLAAQDGLVLRAKPPSDTRLRLDLLLPQGGSVASGSSPAPGGEVNVELGSRPASPTGYVLRVTRVSDTKGEKTANAKVEAYTLFQSKREQQP